MSPNMALTIVDLTDYKARKARRAMIEHARETVALNEDGQEALRFAVEAHARAAIAIAQDVPGVPRDVEAAEEWSRLAADMLAYHKQVTP